MSKEIWKNIENYEGYYKVSNYGRVKSLGRILLRNSKTKVKIKEKLLKQHLTSTGYFKINLNKDNKIKSFKVHQLVAIAFLNHKPCGHKIVIDHINGNPKDNNISNLRLVSNRENINLGYDNKNTTSKYRGVHFNTKSNKWRASIYLNGKLKQLGYFNTELEAYNKYLQELNK